MIVRGVYFRENSCRVTGGSGVTEGDHMEDFDSKEELELKEHKFIKETIKEKPMSGRKKASLLAEIAVGGAVFGLTACLIFYAVAPWAQTHLHKEENVVIQDDDRDPSDPEGNGAEELPVKELLTAEGYQEMMKSISSMLSDVNRSVATITGSNADTTLEENLEFAESRSVDGLLVAETNNYLLFLIPMEGMEGYSKYTMSFGVGSPCDGKIRSMDRNTGLGIVEVPKTTIDSYLTSYYRVATLGNSYAAERGMPIVAVGSPFGIGNSLALGILSSKNAAADIVDADMNLLVSDIMGAKDASGVFVNLSGEVLGIILPDQSVEGSDVLTALSISEIKDVIERLSNRASVPYVGIKGVPIDTATAEAYDLVEGIYVTGVEMDSPAMEAGIQMGDIIEEVNSISINNMDNFHDLLMNTAVGKTIRIKGKRENPDGWSNLSVTITIGALE